MLVRLTTIWLMTAVGVVAAAQEPPGTSVPAVDVPRPDSVQAPKPNFAPRRPLTPEAMADLVTALDSPDFSQRESATRTLAAAATAVPLVAEAARTGSLETRIRAVFVLERIYTNLEGEDASLDAAETALEELARSNHPSTAGRAQAVLARHSDIRQRRAIAAIERLGGKVEFREERLGHPGGGGPQISRVILGRAWKGGDDGLNYLKRLGEAFDLYVIDGTNISSPALLDLQQAIPNLRLQRRGAAYLGIGNVWRLKEGKGCQVGDVVAGAAADKAGVRPGDIIVGFGGKRVPDFETLVEMIGNYSPGEKVEVEVLRPGETELEPVTLAVIMGSWTQ